MESTEFRFSLQFAQSLLEDEQSMLWDALIEEIESMNCYAGGGHSAVGLDWVIDYSESVLERDVIIHRLQQFVNGMGRLIAACRFET